MRPRLVLSHYNRDAYRRVMERTRPGRHRPLVLTGPPGLGKTLLLEILQRRVTSRVIRMTAEEWISRAMRDPSTLSRSLIDAFAGVGLALLDNAETLAGKSQTQALLAQALVTSDRSIVLVTNSDLSTLTPLLEGLTPSEPEILQLARPTPSELRRIACLLSSDRSSDGPRRISGVANPGEVLGLLTQASAQRVLVGAVSS